MSKKKAMLVVLDGWGHGRPDQSNAVHVANTPFVDSLYRDYPNAELTTHGATVGLPEGQMGNSEVGHIHLGAGRVIWQELPRISNAIADGSFFNNVAMKEAIGYALDKKVSVHVFGLVSKGGVHSHVEHGKAVLKAFSDAGVSKLFLHACTDGRDTDPHSGLNCIDEMTRFLASTSGRIASVCGRYYAMDRDKRWERTKRAYDLMVHGKGASVRDPAQGVRDSYARGVTDEFIEPIVVVDENERPLGTIQPDDVIVCFNFRTDRPRQIITALTQKDFPDHEMKRLPLYTLTMTGYDETFSNVKVMFHPQHVSRSFGEIISSQGLTQLRIAETEKYPHVTYFFSGGREEPFEGESRVLIPSPKVATYDLQPEMSAVPVTDAVVRETREHQPDFICLNFANADMVGHTGVFGAAVKAVETVDACLKRVVEAGLQHDYSMIVTADHGNADMLVNEDGSPHTAHTLNPVPVFLLSSGYRGSLRNGTLTDIAPTLLHLMGLDIPEVMTGKPLLDVHVLSQAG